MADSTQQQQDSAQKFDATQSQSQYDVGFESLIGQALPQGIDATSQIVQSYFELVDLTVRQSRRVAEVWTTSMILAQTRQAIVSDVKRQVLAELRQQPSSMSR